jgi:hypothetical protein
VVDRYPMRRGPRAIFEIRQAGGIAGKFPTATRNLQRRFVDKNTEAEEERCRIKQSGHNKGVLIVLPIGLGKKRARCFLNFSLWYPYYVPNFCHGGSFQPAVRLTFFFHLRVRTGGCFQYQHAKGLLHWPSCHNNGAIMDRELFRQHMCETHS